MEKVKIKDAIKDDILKEIFIEQNLGMAHSIAYKYNKTTRIDLEELKAMASFGLVKAFNTFDTSKGYAFSTYAYMIMQNEIRQELRKNNNKEKYGITISLNTPIDDKDGKEASEVIDTLVSQEPEYKDEDVLAAKIVLDTLKKEDEYLYNIFKMFIIEEKTTAEIAKYYNKNQSTASRAATKAVTRAREIALEYDLIDKVEVFRKRKKA
jgi:RNA polymerase sporulation-specific sigma factor